MPEQTDTQTPPLPAPGAPHAYVAVRRTHSPHADRPEWFHRAQVVPAWDEAAIDYALKCGETLLPIGPDGDTGTRWVTEPSFPHALKAACGFARRFGVEIDTEDFAIHHTPVGTLRATWVGERHVVTVDAVDGRVDLSLGVIDWDAPTQEGQADA